MVRTALDDLATDQGAGSRSRGRIGVACPRGESHDLPARIVSALLRNEGWDVTHLGPSVTIDALERYARTVQPVAIALSCTMPTRLMRAAETIQALHRVGLPVIAGGAAFGPTERRASTLGADGWCAHPSGVHRVLQASQRRSRDTDRHIAPNLGALLTDETRARIVDAALRSLARGSDRNPGLTLSDRTAGRVAALLSFAEAAVLTADETVLTDAIAWWHQATRRGSSGAAFLTPGLDALSLAVEPGALHSMLRRGASRDCCPV
jgi:methylmalonyl-CoA mutase cobalamin-binding subunit